MRAIMMAIAVLVSAVSAGPARPAGPSPEAGSYLEHALTLLRERHINSPTADWTKIERVAREQIAGAVTTAETYPAIREVLRTLGEKHSFLVEPRPAYDPASSTDKPSTDNQQPEMPTWQIMGGRFGAVRLPALDTMGEGREVVGKTYTETLKKALQEMDSRPLCGWIVDLRANGGGNMWPMLNGLDPILGEAPFGHFLLPGGEAMPWVRTPGGIAPHVTPFPEARPAFALAHENAPIAVLVGPSTASSGEMVAIAFVGRSDTRTFGQRTAGFATANEVHPLSDGAMLAITVTKVSDRTGKVYDVAVIPDEATSTATAEDAAMRWLSGQCSPAN